MENLPTCVTKKSYQHGDSRMSRAIVTKLNNPDMSLLEALMIGGFVFSNIDVNYTSWRHFVRDEDGVLLGQRKNQLCRGLKDAREQIKINKKQKVKDRSDTSLEVKFDVKDASNQSKLPRKEKQARELNGVGKIYSNVLLDENEGATDVESVDSCDTYMVVFKNK